MVLDELVADFQLTRPLARKHDEANFAAWTSGVGNPRDAGVPHGQLAARIFFT